MIFRKTRAAFAFTRILGSLLALLWSTVGVSAAVRVDEYPVNVNIGNPWLLRAMIEGRDGNLYGTSEYGPPNNSCGSVFRFDRATLTYTVLHEFTPTEGCFPNRLVERADGVFYGTTRIHGSSGFGTVFSITADGHFALLHSFAGGTDGGSTDGELLLASDGNIYGATAGYPQAPSAKPTFFKIDALDRFATVVVFDDIPGGSSTVAAPHGAIVEAPDGSFYGTTYLGGTSFTPGAIYRVTTTGNVSILHSFSIPGIIHPYGGLTKASDGNYYGTTADASGGTQSGGIFRVTPDGLVQTLSQFEQYTQPTHALVDGGDGYLYGASNQGGLFRASFDGTVTFLRVGMGDVGTLVKSVDGYIWGVRVGAGTLGATFRLHAPESTVAIETPSPGAIVTEPFVVSGWAIDQSVDYSTGIDFLHVWAFPAGGGAPIFVGTTGYGTPRLDVRASYGYYFTNSGFGLTVRNLPTGTYTLVFYPHSPVWNAFDFGAVKSVVVTVSSTELSHPGIGIESPAAGPALAPTFHVTGWAIDMVSASGTGVDAVHVWAYPDPGSSKPPIFLGAASYGISRPDIAALYGANFQKSGYDLFTSTLTPGVYRIAVFARSSISGVFAAATRDITVRTLGNSYLELDKPTNGSTLSQPFLFAGWTIDTDAISGPGIDAVHLWAYPAAGGPAIFLGVASYGGYRYDVSVIFDQPICFYPDYPVRALCQFGFSAFGLNVSGLPAGQYQLVAFAHSYVTGRFDKARAVDVTVQ